MKVQCPFCMGGTFAGHRLHCPQCGRPMLEVFDIPLPQGSLRCIVCGQTTVASHVPAQAREVDAIIVPDEWTVEKLTVLLRVIMQNAARHVAPNVIANQLHDLAVNFEGEAMFTEHREQTNDGT